MIPRQDEACLRQSVHWHTLRACLCMVCVCQGAISVWLITMVACVCVMYCMVMLGAFWCPHRVVITDWHALGSHSSWKTSWFNWDHILFMAVQGLHQWEEMSHLLHLFSLVEALLKQSWHMGLDGLAALSAGIIQWSNGHLIMWTRIVLLVVYYLLPVCYLSSQLFMAYQSLNQ